MSERLLTFEDMQQYVGTEAKLHVLKVEKEIVRRFLDAVQDANPLWCDEEYARSTHFGGPVVPPHIFCAIMTIARCSPEAGRVPVPVPEVPLPRDNVLEGEERWEFFSPLRIGDTITSRVRLADLKHREGRLGEMFILTYEAETVNQHGDVVAKSINTLVNY